MEPRGLVEAVVNGGFRPPLQSPRHTGPALFCWPTPGGYYELGQLYHPPYSERISEKYSPPTDRRWTSGGRSRCHGHTCPDPMSYRPHTVQK